MEVAWYVVTVTAHFVTSTFTLCISVPSCAHQPYSIGTGQNAMRRSSLLRIPNRAHQTPMSRAECDRATAAEGATGVPVVVVVLTIEAMRVERRAASVGPHAAHQTNNLVKPPHSSKICHPASLASVLHAPVHCAGTPWNSATPWHCPAGLGQRSRRRDNRVSVRCHCSVILHGV
jgi:hypothetical protein